MMTHATEHVDMQTGRTPVFPKALKKGKLTTT